MIGWVKRALTDREGEPDTARIMVPVVIGTMCYMAVTGEHYEPQSFGIGIGAVLAGFSAYLYGDAKRP